MTRPNGVGNPHTTSHILDLFLTNNVLDITNTKVIPNLVTMTSSSLTQTSDLPDKYRDADQFSSFLELT